VGSLKKVLVTLLLGCAIGTGITIGTFGSALLQEGNPIPILLSAVKLTFSERDYVQFTKTEKQSSYLSQNTGSNPYHAIKEFMKSMGWTFEEQMGAGLIFIKGEKEAIVLTRQYSRYFFIWDILKTM